MTQSSHSPSTGVLMMRTVADGARALAAVAAVVLAVLSYVRPEIGLVHVLAAFGLGAMVHQLLTMAATAADRSGRASSSRTGRDC